MDTSKYSETQLIELATATAFFGLYNLKNVTTYSVSHVAGHGEVPDIFASDADGRQFNLEITLTEDDQGDIQSLLGRSDKHSLQALKAENEAVRLGKAQPRINSLHGNALPVLLNRIAKKLTKQYGKNTALVVRDTSVWDWELVIPTIEGNLAARTVPFDLGIWLLNAAKTKIFQLHPGTSNFASR